METEEQITSTQPANGHEAPRPQIVRTVSIEAPETEQPGVSAPDAGAAPTRDEPQPRRCLSSS